MKLIGWTLALVGVVLLAVWGLGLWSDGCPCMIGLSNGQVVFALAAIVIAGLVLITRATMGRSSGT
jgi:hypothetical protein